METILLRSLLLACCLSGAEVLQTGKDESKDCVILLTELKVKMEYLQKEHEAQAVKLKDLENQKTQVNVMKSQLKAQATALASIKATSTITGSQVKALQQDMKAQAVNQKTEVNVMKSQLKAQATALDSIKATSTITGSQVKALQQDMKVKQVAFSASLVASVTTKVGPYNRLIPLVYKNVITNIGNAYNSNTGVFTAPVKGAYHFQFYIIVESHVAGVVLVKNGKHVFTAYENQKSGYGSASNGVSLLLNVGDAVAMHLWHGTRVYDDKTHHTTFSGHLLFTT